MYGTQPEKISKGKGCEQVCQEFYTTQVWLSDRESSAIWTIPKKYAMTATLFWEAFGSQKNQLFVENRANRIGSLKKAGLPITSSRIGSQSEERLGFGLTQLRYTAMSKTNKDEGSWT